MIQNFLVTKVLIPQVQLNVVSRPRLLAQLKEGQLPGRKFTLISAPAGYGKTTLVVEWLKGLKSRSAWVSIDETDNDPVRFFSYLVAALQQSGIKVGSSIIANLQLPQQIPLTSILSQLINELARLPEPLVLVLDDYHSIQTQAIHQQLSFILEHQPKNLHLVISTREDPPLPLGRLRASGQLTEIREIDLRFDHRECALFLQKAMGLELSDQEITALKRRTEGWIAGLQMAALSLHGRTDIPTFIQDFTGSNRFIMDYLTEEVLNRQPAETQTFLLTTSILERFSAPLCFEITGHPQSQALLETLEQANLFIIPLDQSRQWYRYHRMFAELLRHRLRSDNPTLEATLHNRSSRWFETQNLPVEAIQHALAAQDWGRTAALIGQIADSLLKKGEAVTLINWFQKFPSGFFLTQLNLGLAYAWALLLTGQFSSAEKLLAEFEIVAQPNTVLSGHVATAQAFAARAGGDNRRVIQKSKQALALLPESEINSRATLALNLGLVFWHEGQLQEALPSLFQAQELSLLAGNYYGDLTSQIFIARTKASQGALRQAEAMYLKILNSNSKNPAFTLAYYDLSALYYEWNLLERAWEYVEVGLELCLLAGNTEFQNSGHMLKAIYHQAQGNLSAAFSEIEICQSLSRDLNPTTQSRTHACHALITLGIPDLAQAKYWLDQMQEDVDPHPFYRFLGLTRARFLLAQGKQEKAREVLQALLAKANQSECGYGKIPIMAMLASISKERNAAVDLLAQTLLLSQTQGFIRSFVDLGEPLIPLLKETARKGHLPEYIGEILSAYRSQIHKSVPLVIELISKRELEILRLVAAGLSNREIASQLFISTGTAKTHVHNLCGKLGVRNRTEAAMRAKEIGLV